MANKTAISWTDFTSNVIRFRNAAGQIVHACVKQSPGCADCYAEAIATSARMKPPGWGIGQKFTAENMRHLTPFLDEAEMHRLATSKTVSGKRVFLCDMTDWLGPWIPWPMIQEILVMVKLRRDVIFQLLTKQAARLPELLEKCAPIPNVLIGISAERQKELDERGLYLRKLAAVGWNTFISAEPLLDSLSFGFQEHLDCQLPKQIIFGALSGAKWMKHPCDPEWIASGVAQCRAAGVAAWVKQGSAFKPGQQADLPDELFAVKEHAQP